MAFFISVRILAAMAFIILNWAISLGNVALINALQGVQYIFSFTDRIYLSSRYSENFKRRAGGRGDIAESNRYGFGLHGALYVGDVKNHQTSDVWSARRPTSDGLPEPFKNKVR
jgi:hypothetical protein